MGIHTIGIGTGIASLDSARLGVLTFTFRIWDGMGKAVFGNLRLIMYSLLFPIILFFLGWYIGIAV